MSLVLQIGQCGNQLGQQVFKDLYAHKDLSNSEILEEFFHSYKNKLYCNALSIDMESKVIDNLLLMNSDISYNSKFCFKQEEGSGNNWGYGYYHHGNNCFTQIENKFRKIMEQIDFTQNLIFIQSMAGGTGSGVGSFLIEQLREQYSNKYFLTFLIAPQLGGEVIIQNYNSIFSLVKVFENSDSFFILENDKSKMIIEKIHQTKSVNMEKINEIMSTNIVSSLLSGNRISQTFANVFSELVIFPETKILSNRFVPQTPKNLQAFNSDTWNGIINRGFQSLLSGSSEANIRWNLNPQISQQIVKSFSIHGEFYSKDLKNLNDIVLSKEFVFNNQKIYHSSLINPNFSFNQKKWQLFDLPISMCLISNSNEFIPYFDITYQKGKDMFGQKAYLHQYIKYGMDYDEMVDMFHKFDYINSIYKKINQLIIWQLIIQRDYKFQKDLKRFYMIQLEKFQENNLKISIFLAINISMLKNMDQISKPLNKKPLKTFNQNQFNNLLLNKELQEMKIIREWRPYIQTIQKIIFIKQQSLKEELLANILTNQKMRHMRIWMNDQVIQIFKNI